jgi:hypothetical protein
MSVPTARARPERPGDHCGAGLAVQACDETLPGPWQRQP